MSLFKHLLLVTLLFSIGCEDKEEPDTPPVETDTDEPNTDPTVDITSPTSGAVFYSGDEISLEGQVTDAEDAVSDLTIAVYDGADEICTLSTTPDGFLACDFVSYLGKDRTR